MTNPEQAKRLKAVGYQQDILRCGKTTCNGVVTDIAPYKPDEKELMEFLAKQSGVRITIYGSGVCWYVDVGYNNHSISSDDLTECLVQAVEAILKGREGR